MSEVHCRDGFEINVAIYFVSDKTGLECCVNMGGLKKLSQDTLDTAVRCPMPDFADDWRLMTAEEIADYKRRQDEPDE